MSDAEADTTASDVLLSVVICTFNRADMLEASLDSWRQLVFPEAGIELLVVDNKSTDATRNVVHRLQDRDGAEIRYLFEEEAGLSFARNSGITAARGKLIAFVDDDVFFDRHWLKSMLAAFDKHPDADALGGRTLPSYESPAPDWMAEEAMKFYGATDAGDEAGRMAYPAHPFGVNMAFRRRVFDEIGTFNTSLGRKGTSLLSNEEKDLFFRMHKADMMVRYVPEAIIHHRVPAERLDKRWLRRRAYWQGASDILFDQLVDPKSKGLLSRKLYQTVVQVLRTLVWSSFATELRRRRYLGECRQYCREILRMAGLPKLRRGAQP